MADDREDLIEAIKRRNEERARRLRERIAKGDFDKFETPFEAVDDVLPTGPETIQAPAADFDLGSFPPPPEPAPFTLDEGPARAAVAPPDFTPPDFGPPDFGPPGFAPPELGAPEPEGAAVYAEPDIAPPAAAAPVADTVAEESFVGLELTALDLEGMSEFLAPQAWDGAEAPAAAAKEFPPPQPAAAPPRRVVEIPPAPALEIEVEPVVEMPPAIEVITPAPLRPAPAFAEEVPTFAEPRLREEEAEAIKATIEEELREMPPAAPPMPPRPAAPVIEVPMAPVAAPVAPRRVEIPVAPAPAPAPAAEITIAVEVRGNKVRIERRNITLAAAIELFQAIINRYENK